MAKKLLLKKNNQIIENLTREIPENGIISVGSDSTAVLCLENESIAPEQFIIICEDGKLMLLNRAAGTFYNDLPLAPGALQEINLDDEIKTGEFLLIPSSQNGFVKNPPAPEKSLYTAPALENNSEEQIHLTMNDVLENLRSDEKFYFLVEDERQGKQRVYVEYEEMWLGWSVDGLCVVSENPANIQTPRAQIRKDWSGVVLYPIVPQTVAVNQEILTEPYRLKNDDQLFLQPVDSSSNLQTSIRFHEPTALLVLDSILPKELPPPVSMPRRRKPKTQTAETAIAVGKTQNLAVKNQVSPATIKHPARIFGYFTWTEILIMAIGTLFTAAMIFLVLELF